MTPLETIKHHLEEQFLFIDPQVFLDKYQFHPAYTNGEVVGYMLTDGQEVHMMACPGGKMTRRHIRELLVPYLKKHGWLWTAALKDSPSNQFLLRFGFKQTGGDGVKNFYRIDEVKYA